MSSAATPFDVVAIGSWDEFQKTVAGPAYKSWAFRGQENADWPVFSSLSRHLRDFHVDPSAWATQEERIVRVFKRKAHLYLDHVPDPEDDFQWLALMQHHGSPTRLLDFTWSPFVAAFFALEKAKSAAAVWAICTPRIWNSVITTVQATKTLLASLKMNLKYGQRASHQ